MTVVFDGDFWVSYGQMYVVSTGSTFDYELNEAFANQSNGLCGASTPGALWLTTGLHTGTVNLTVKKYDSAPQIDDDWEEIVEVSYRPMADDTALNGWGGSALHPLGLATIDYRVRYSAKDMDAGADADGSSEIQPVDSYLLQFWPAPPEPDRVVKQTSQRAAYWHRFASELPPPKTPEQKLEARRIQEEHQREAALRVRQFSEQRRWNGLPAPSAELLKAGGRAPELAALDRELFDAIVRAGSDVQTEIARWLAIQNHQPPASATSGRYAVAVYVGSGPPLRRALDAIYRAATGPDADQSALFAEVRQRFSLDGD